MDKLSKIVSNENNGIGLEQMQKNRVESQKLLGEDPRIDSPEINVVYPSITHGLPSYTELPEADEGEPEAETTTEERGEKCTCDKECKVDWLTAIKQNGTHFLLMALVLLVLGYALGGRRT